MESNNEASPKCQSEPAVKYLREVLVNYRRSKKEIPAIKHTGDAAKFIRSTLPDNSREHLIAVYLDASHQVIGYAVTSTGSPSSCPAHPREVFQRAVLLGAVAVILGHNHPSGLTTPSRADESVTRIMKEAGELLGIKLLDHLIVTDNEHHSFALCGDL